MYKGGPASVLAVLFTANSLGDIPKLGMFFESLAEKDGRNLHRGRPAEDHSSGKSGRSWPATSTG